MPEENPPTKPEKIQDRCFDNGKSKVWIDRMKGSIVVICKASEKDLIGEIAKKYPGAVRIPAKPTPSMNGPETWITIKPAIAKDVTNPYGTGGEDEGDKPAKNDKAVKTGRDAEQKWTEAKNEIITELSALIESHGFKLNEAISHKSR